MKDKPIIRPATAEDIMIFNGGEPYQETVRAWVVEYKGELACIAGVARLNTNVLLAFSKVKEGTEAPDITVYKTALQLFDKIKALGLDVVANPEENITGAPRFLKHLGFKSIGGGYYKWHF